jgi:hypothetical protein
MTQTSQYPGGSSDYAPSSGTDLKDKATENMGQLAEKATD